MIRNLLVIVKYYRSSVKNHNSSHRLWLHFSGISDDDASGHCGHSDALQFLAILGIFRNCLLSNHHDVNTHNCITTLVANFASITKPTHILSFNTTSITFFIKSTRSVHWKYKIQHIDVFITLSVTTIKRQANELPKWTPTDCFYGV